jgi:hypothetical protein
LLSFCSLEIFAEWLDAILVLHHFQLYSVMKGALLAPYLFHDVVLPQNMALFNDAQQEFSAYASPLLALHQVFYSIDIHHPSLHRLIHHVIPRWYGSVCQSLVSNIFTNTVRRRNGYHEKIPK